MKKLIMRIKNWLIVKLGGYTREAYKEMINSHNKIFKQCIDSIKGCVRKNERLVEALKDSNVLDRFYGVKYSYSLCSYCTHKNDCDKNCAHREDFVFAENWKEN